MKTNLFKLFLAIVLVSTLSCGNEEKIIDHFAECAATLETCENGCEPTKAQLDALKSCDQICFFNHAENGFDSYYECYLFCETQVYGENTPQKCSVKCKESFYECGFGPDWKDLNIKEPQ